MRYSIRVQFILFLFGLMMLTVLLCIVLNTVFLPGYYLREKERALEKTFRSINTAASSGDISSDDFDVELMKAVGRDGVSVIVMDPDSRTIKSFSVDTALMTRRLYDNLLGENESISSEDAAALEEGRLRRSESASASYIPSAYLISVLYAAGNGTMQVVLDSATNTRFLELWGTLDSGDFFLLRTALESIENSAAIANRFFVYVAIPSTLLGILLALYLGERVTRPIRELTAISERMKRLDFGAKYTGRDRTEVAELGANINELSETLERTISELKTANSQLRKDIRRREELDAARREFLSNVTHELKTPLALIQGYAEGLIEGVSEDAESRSSYAGVIMDEAKKMNVMVQRLLALDHLESGAEAVRMERFDVAELIGRYLSSAELLAGCRDVTVRFAQRGERIDVWSDPFLVEEAFTNYFSNACHYVESADGEKYIDIRIVPCKEDAGRVRVSVFNSGLPIPEESLPHIWEKFYKVDRARTRAYGGSGLGLSIVRAAMELLGQDYGVRNYDNGVEFYLTLDARAVEEDAAL
ncbi:sensor histidine kinase [Lachnoclostridium sp. Marseille-P6806]|uniref:sensor histidine kinase n=1 Tax=Lachnoclostridium sp. Marseille-P6806 TaxID=2364793 RepID=UPI00102FDE0A|nr:HAMP domain-containing sensor histidine kinase [Lachnoclostridium sp. Marseille-P6806]